MNLLSNAIKFSSKRERAVIEVGADRMALKLSTTCATTGAGFDIAMYVPKLFGVFQRLHARTGIRKGTGRRPGHRPAGDPPPRRRVWAEGEVDRGATFYFTLQEAE